ncbi:hypothetical protein [uncultured Ruminococcus sp.]|uniref:hypothetical protein n=1 Tax=uncultured Ruminococcus sp. TaxID=165186 RepID=UPI0020677C5C|nr:hypothetical protein [uncultured Ruminococcus sp.]DAL79717.1 MAG TPA: hypothetical protein [Caudoviricetes sp.]
MLEQMLSWHALPAYTARSPKAWRRFKYYVLALSGNQLTVWANRKLMHSRSA